MVLIFLYATYKTTAIPNAIKTFSFGPVAGILPMTGFVQGLAGVTTATTPLATKVRRYSVHQLFGIKFTIYSPFLVRVNSYFSSDIFTLASLSNTWLVGFQRKISTLSDPSIAVQLQTALFAVIGHVTFAKLIFAPAAA